MSNRLVYVYIVLSIFSLQAMEDSDSTYIALQSRNQKKIEKLYENCARAIKFGDTADLKHWLSWEGSEVAQKAIMGDFAFSDVQDPEMLPDSLFDKIKCKKKSWKPTIVRGMQGLSAGTLLLASLYQMMSISEENTLAQKIYDGLGAYATFIGFSYLMTEAISNAVRKSSNNTCELMKAILKAKLPDVSNREYASQDSEGIEHLYYQCCEAIKKRDKKLLERSLQDAGNYVSEVIHFNPQLNEVNEQNSLHNNLFAILKREKNKPYYGVRIMQMLMALGLGTNATIGVFKIISKDDKDIKAESVSNKVFDLISLNANYLEAMYLMKQAVSSQVKNEFNKEYAVMKYMLQRYARDV